MASVMFAVCSFLSGRRPTLYSIATNTSLLRGIGATPEMTWGADIAQEKTSIALLLRVP